MLALGRTLRHTAPLRWLQDHRNDFSRLRAVEVSMFVRWNGPQAPWWKTRTRRVHAEAERFQQDWEGEDDAMLRIEGGDFLWVDDRQVVKPDGPLPAPTHQMGGTDLLLYFRTQFAEFVHAARGAPHRSVLAAEGVRLTRLVDRVIESALRNAAQATG